jgi:hypothetical protein
LKLGAEVHFPAVGRYADLKSEQFVHWLNAILFSALLLLQLAFQRETLYPLRHMFRLMLATAPSSECVTATTVSSSSNCHR